MEASNRVLSHFITAFAMALLCAARTAAFEVRIEASHVGSTSADSVGTTIPVPDVSGAVGPEHFVELLNGRYAVYDEETGVPVESSSQIEFWSRAGIAGVIDQAADPRILYDATTARWYAAALRLAPDATQDDLLLFAVSRGSDPTQGWDAFQLDADPSTLNWLDFSMMGFDADGVYLSVSRMAPGTGAFRGTGVAALPKADLLAAVPTLAGATVLTTTVGQTGFDPQPAVDLDGSGLPLPLVSGNSAFAGQLQASRLEGPISTPSLVGGLLIPVDPAPGPPDAEQPGEKLPLETGGRNNASLFSGSVVLRNGSLWAAQGIEVDGRAAIRWLEVDPHTNLVLQSGVISDGVLDLYTASIAVNEFDQVVIGMTGSSETVFPSAYAVVGERVDDATVFGDLLLLRAGVSDYERVDARGRNAWGDYSSTVTDPLDPLAFWTFQEFVIDTDVWGVSITKLVLQAPECGDGVDDDGDGLVDFPSDPGCTRAGDVSERTGRACDDAVDNDGDGFADFPSDPGCKSVRGTREDPACQNGVDDDQQPGVDFDGGASLNGGVPIAAPDPQCLDTPWRTTESKSCGLGAEIAALLLLVKRLRRRDASRSAG